VKILSTGTLALLAVLAFLLALPSPSLADDSGGYVVLKGGGYFPTASSAIPSGQSFTFPPSGDVELGLGGAFGLLGVQLDAGYLWTKNSSGQANGVPITGVLQLRFPVLFVVPYVEAGVGLFINTARVSVGSATSASSTKASFMAPFGGGVDVLLGPLLLGAEVRYIYISPTDYNFSTSASSNVATLRMDGVVVTADVGYRF
jgi:hypothetical protein